jgi:hypothetical protein
MEEGGSAPLPGVIAMGPRMLPRAVSKRGGNGPSINDVGVKAGGSGTERAVASSEGDGEGGGEFAIPLSDFVKNPGAGGSGGGMGAGNGAGMDRGRSMDMEPRLISSQRLRLPNGYATGLVRVAHAAKFKVWVRADNTVEKIELVQSSGDKAFDGLVRDYYEHATYLAGTRNGDSAKLSIEVSYSIGGEE